MTNLHRPLIMMLLACNAAAANAFGGSSEFWLDPIIGLGESAAQPGSVGYWRSPNNVDLFVLTSGHAGAEPRADTYHSFQLDPKLSAGDPFGHLGTGLAALPGDPTSAHAAVAPGHLSADWRSSDAHALGDGVALWQRAFALLPNKSVTLSGLAVLSNASPITVPTPPSFSFVQPVPASGPPDQASLYYRYDGLVGLGVNLTTHVQHAIEDDGDHGEFGYSTDSFGHLSMTLSNHSDHVLLGWFDMAVFAQPTVPTSPIPEPSTWAMLALGAILFGRKHHARDPRP